MTTFNKTLISTDNLYFDLLEYIANMHSVYVAAEMAQSTAWRIDTMLVAGGRGLLRFIKEELYNRGGFESLSEVQIAFEDAAFAEHNFNEIGSGATGIIENLRWLNAQRDQWHELAARLVPMVNDYRGMPMVYVTPDIHLAFHKDPVLRVNETAQRRLKVRSERIAQALGAPELADAHFQRSIQRKEDNNKRVASLLKDQAPIAELMFTLALRSDDSSAALRSKDFYDLPIDTQRTLIDNASNAAMRADERAADDRNMSETEYDIISLSAIKAMTDMKKILSSPRFRAPAVEPSQV